MLKKTYVKFCKDVHKIRTILNAVYKDFSISGELTHRDKILIDGCVISLYDRWTYFNRHIILHSAIGGCTTARGLNIPCNVLHKRDIKLALSNFLAARRVQMEPKWGIASEAISVARWFSIANFSNYSAAIGAVGSPAEELRYVRNFFAHKGDEARTKLQKNVTFFSTYPFSHQAFLSYKVSGRQPLYENWSDRLINFAGAAIQ